MPQNESITFVPLRSNASTLLTGAPITAMRRRLKFASVYHDHMLLEAGILTVQASPNTGSIWLTEPTKQRPARWQSPRGRQVARQQYEQMMASAREAAPGLSPKTLSSLINSETSGYDSGTGVYWEPTLHPFAHELPPGTDWVNFVRTTPDVLGEIVRLATRWRSADQSNTALKRAMPDRTVRNTVIENVNRDLAVAASNGFALMIDPVHAQVVAQRFRDYEGWGLRGYVVPIIIPQVGELPWSAISDLRRDRQIARFRAVLREVEDEATAEAAGGDVESAAHHALERHLAGATEKLEGIGAPVHRAAAGFAVGGIAGFATTGIPGPGGIFAGAALGAVPSTIIDIRKTIRRRRSDGWVGLYQKIIGSGGAP